MSTTAQLPSAHAIPVSATTGVLGAAETGGILGDVGRNGSVAVTLDSPREISGLARFATAQIDSLHLLMGFGERVVAAGTGRAAAE